MEGMKGALVRGVAGGLGWGVMTCLFFLVWWPSLFFTLPIGFIGTLALVYAA